MLLLAGLIAAGSPLATIDQAWLARVSREEMARPAETPRAARAVPAKAAPGTAKAERRPRTGPKGM